MAVSYAKMKADLDNFMKKAIDKFDLSDDETTNVRKSKKSKKKKHKSKK